MIELSIKVSNSEQALTYKHLIHEEGLCLSKDDPTLSALVLKAIEDFKGAVDDVIVKIKMVW